MTTRDNTQDTLHPEPVLVLDAATQEEAEVAHATLLAAGINATLRTADADVVVGAVDPALGTAYRRGLFVAPNNFQAALQVLAQGAISEEDLTREEEEDATTLEQAEKAALDL